MITNGPTTVRAARSGDADAIRSIYNEAVANTTATMDTEPRTPAQQAAWMAAHDGSRYPALAAVDAQGAVVGYASLSTYNPKPGYRTTAETSIYVHCDRRGRGVGGALLEALVGEAERHGFCSLVALITAENAVSRRLHERQGFVSVGTLARVARKFDRWIDVTVLQKQLNEHG